MMAEMEVWPPGEWETPEKKKARALERVGAPSRSSESEEFGEIDEEIPVGVTLETLGIVEAAALELEGASVIPSWTSRDRAFVADAILWEGTLTTASYVRTKTKERVLRPVVRVMALDKDAVEEEARLFGIKMVEVKHMTRRYGIRPAYAATAGGTRAALVVARAWNNIMEGVRKRRFRDWMFDLTIPYVRAAVAVPPPMGPAIMGRIRKETGVTKSVILSTLDTWELLNKDLPRLPWREADREQLWRTLPEKVPKVPEVEIKE